MTQNDTCQWRRAVGDITRSNITPKMKANALALLDATGTIGDGRGEIKTEAETVARLFNIGSRGTLRQYLATLRTAGIINYRLTQESLTVFFLAWRAAPQPRIDNPPASNPEQRRQTAAMPVAPSDAPWRRVDAL